MAKKISLSVAHELLLQCPVVELEGQFLETQVYDLADEDLNEFLCLSWTEIIEGEEVIVMLTFNERDNKTPKIDGNVITLISSEDKVEEELTLYTRLFNDGK